VSFLPAAKSKVAPSISHGSTRMNVCAGVFKRRNAPNSPPMTLVRHQWHHHPPRETEAVTVGSAAGAGTDPQAKQFVAFAGWAERPRTEALESYKTPAPATALDCAASMPRQIAPLRSGTPKT